MPRGIPGSGKVKKTAAAAPQSTPSAEQSAPAQAKRKYTKKAVAGTAPATTVAAPKSRYTDLERFSAAQSYLLMLAEAAIKLNSLQAQIAGLGVEITATIAILGELRESIFGTGGAGPAPAEVAEARTKADERIRQSLPPPTNATHVGPSVHAPVVQQAPFVPGAAPPGRMQ